MSSNAKRLENDLDEGYVSKSNNDVDSYENAALGCITASLAVVSEFWPSLMIPIGEEYLRNSRASLGEDCAQPERVISSNVC